MDWSLSNQNRLRGNGALLAAASARSPRHDVAGYLQSLLLRETFRNEAISKVYNSISSFSSSAFARSAANSAAVRSIFGIGSSSLQIFYTTRLSLTLQLLRSYAPVVAYSPRRNATNFNAGSSALPSLPDDGSKPAPDPLVECAQHRRRLAEAEVAAPPDEVTRHSLTILIYEFARAC